MDCINKVELVGFLGKINFLSAGSKERALLSLVTRLEFKKSDGSTFSEVTWHTVNSPAVLGGLDLKTLKYGSALRILGRLRSVQYTDSQKVQRSSFEVVAESIEKI